MTITNEDVERAWRRYERESRGHERGSVAETVAWDKYMAVMKQLRSQN
jgi:hypothetical protein